MDAIGVNFARLHNAVLDLNHRDVSRHRHDRVEVALGEAELQVAKSVGAVGADEREIGGQRVFQHVGASVDFPVFLALGQLGADAGGGVERADAGGGSAHPLGQGALGNQLGVQLIVVVHLDERGDLRRMGGSGKGADHFLDLAGFDQGPHIDTVIQTTGVVGDARQVFDAQAMHGGQQVAGQAHVAETRRHESHAVLHVGDGGIEIGIDLVLHRDWLPVQIGRLQPTPAIIQATTTLAMWPDGTALPGECREKLMGR